MASCNKAQQSTTIHRDKEGVLVADLKPRHHLCCLYSTEEERWAVLMPFLRQGLEQNEKVIYAAHEHTAESVLDYLRKERVEIDSHLAQGQLSIVTSSSTYLRNRIFHPEAMIDLIRAETERALAEGYAGLRVTGEMTWALEKPRRSRGLIEYEAKVNTLLSRSRCIGLCQYDRTRFSPLVILNMLYTHPLVVVGTRTYNNFYYLPPEEFLAGDVPAVFMRHLLKNLVARKALEEELCDAREQLIAIQERIVELRKVNETLQEEIARRKHAEDELRKGNQALRALRERK